MHLVNLEEKIKNIRKQLGRFLDVIVQNETSLVPVTRRLVEEQQQRLNSPSSAKKTIVKMM